MKTTLMCSFFSGGVCVCVCVRVCVWGGGGVLTDVADEDDVDVLFLLGRWTRLQQLLLGLDHDRLCLAALRVHLLLRGAAPLLSTVLRPVI